MAPFLSNRLVFLCTAAICLLWMHCMPVMAQDKPVMRWLMVHFPPSIILVDDKPTLGTADVRLKLIMDRWPEVKHEFIVVKPSRVWKEMADPDGNACANLAIFTPERDRLYYMATTSLGPPVGVVARPEVLRTMAKNARGEILPGALLDRTDPTYKA